MIFLLLVIVALQDAAWLDGTAFGLSALAVALVWQVFQVVAFMRSPPTRLRRAGRRGAG